MALKQAFRRRLVELWSKPSESLSYVSHS